MHLVIVSPFPPSITGVGQYGYHLTRAIENTGAFSHIIVLAGARAKRDNHLNHLDKTEIDYCWHPGQSNARHAILARIKNLDPDLVWFNFGASAFGKSPFLNLSGMFTPMLARRAGYPTIVTLHELVALTDLHALNAPGGMLAPLGARLLTKIATQADVVCLTMHHYVDWLTARGVDCMYIPIGAYHEPEILPEPDTQNLLFFTTFAPYKGMELLLEAFGNLRTEFPQLHLTIAGAAHMRFPDYARDLKNRFNGSHNIQWLGQVAEENVRELFRRAQIVVLPYTASTGSSSVLYQAATWGRTVIASNLDENQRLARENDINIQFFESGNAKSLQDSIRALLNSPGLRKSQAESNFIAIQRLRPAATSRHYLAAFNRALRKRQSPKRISVTHEEMELS